MSIKHFYSYHSHFTKFFDKDLHLFELSVWVQSFALALISVFVPIILWRIGLSIQSIAGFYLLFNAIDVPLNFVAQDFIQKYGARLAVIVAIIFELAYFTTLFTMNNSLIHILILAICLAVFDTFYWVGHLYIFAEAARKNSTVRGDVGTLRVIRMVGGICAPFIGAMILVYADQQTLIFISTLIMSLSLIPLFKMHHLKFKPEQPLAGPAAVFRRPHERVNYLGEALIGVKSELEDVIWPFFIFLVFASIETVSYIPMLVSFVGLVLVYVTARFSLRKRVYALVCVGSLAISLVWILRLLNFGSLWFVMASVFAVAILSVFIEVPLEVNIFERSRQIGSLPAVTYLNASRMLGRATLYIILFIILLFMNGQKTGAYFMSAFNIVICSTALLGLLAFYAAREAIHHRN